MILDHDALFAFVAFADRLNFTHAAAALHVSQPALHVKVGKLADAIGRPLYRRQGRTLVLTPEGERLAAFGRQAAVRAERAVADVRGERAAHPVVLASGAGAFVHLLGPAIRRFPKQRWPLRLWTLAGPAARDAVMQGRADLAVVVLDEAAIAGVQIDRLKQVGQHVILPHAHRLATRRRLRPADLVDEPLIVAPTGSPHRALLEAAFRGVNAGLTVAVEATGWEVMLHFAACGVGLAIVNDFCPVPARMVAVPLEGVATVTYALLSAEDPTEGAVAMRALVRELVAEKRG